MRKPYDDDARQRENRTASRRQFLRFGMESDQNDEKSYGDIA